MSLFTFRSKFSARQLALGCALGAAFAASSSQAYVVTEVGDAGQTQATAQSTAGSGALTDIFGSLLSVTDADLYIVNITNPMLFSATTNNATGGFLDSQVFLLTLAGAPVYFNDDANGTTLLSTLPSGSRFGPTTAGSYLLGVAGSGYNPVNRNNQLLFATQAQGYLSTDVAGPASGLQPAVLAGFSDDATFQGNFGRYDLQLTGVGIAAASVPEPTTGALVLLAGAIGAVAAPRRRRATTAVAA